MKFKTPDPHLKNQRMAKLVLRLKAEEPAPRVLGKILRSVVESLVHLADQGATDDERIGEDILVEVKKFEDEEYIEDIQHSADLFQIWAEVLHGLTMLQAMTLVRKFMDLPLVEVTKDGPRWEARFLTQKPTPRPERIRIRPERTPRNQSR